MDTYEQKLQNIEALEMANRPADRRKLEEAKQQKIIRGMRSKSIVPRKTPEASMVLKPAVVITAVAGAFLIMSSAFNAYVQTEGIKSDILSDYTNIVTECSWANADARGRIPENMGPMLVSYLENNENGEVTYENITESMYLMGMALEDEVVYDSNKLIIDQVSQYVYNNYDLPTKTIDEIIATYGSDLGVDITQTTEQISADIMSILVDEARNNTDELSYGGRN